MYLYFFLWPIFVVNLTISSSQKLPADGMLSMLATGYKSPS